MQSLAQPLAGLAGSTGAFLIVVGIAKGLPLRARTQHNSAIGQLLGVTAKRLRIIEAGTGGLECVTGGAICAGVSPALSGTTTATFGVIFTSLVITVHWRGIPGGCGCTGRAREQRGATGWRTIARAAWLIMAGLVIALMRPGVPAEFASPLFLCGAAAGGACLLLLSVDLPLRTPRCHRPPWRAVRQTLKLLRRHPAYASMGATIGLCDAQYTYRRAGCTDEFWIPVRPGAGAMSVVRDGPRAVLFQVAHAPDGALAVYAIAQDDLPPLRWRQRQNSQQPVEAGCRCATRGACHGDDLPATAVAGAAS